MSAFAEMEALYKTFEKYAGVDGDKSSITKNEVKKMLVIEFEAPDTENEGIDSFFKILDADGDGVVKFPEFVTFLAAFYMLLKDRILE